MASDIIKGLGTTLREFGRKPVTVSYPEQQRNLSPRFRGRHALHRYENGLERCVGCFLCAAACPADAIYIEPAENTPEQQVSAGERYSRIFDINLLRCIFCGYCENACPTGAITLTNQFELAAQWPEDMVYHKEQMLDASGVADRGNAADWYPQPPEETPQSVPARQGYFDGGGASAAAVGQGDLESRKDILLGSEFESKG